LNEAHPKGRFWLKVDACDVKAALQESVNGEWNGDIDLGDDSLNGLRKDYIRRQKSTVAPSPSPTRNPTIRLPAYYLPFRLLYHGTIQKYQQQQISMPSYATIQKC
jgi:hypothetical protein